ncbi:MAG TPA: hypothetical protein VF474_16465 [Phenylobacterium sp.]
MREGRAYKPTAGMVRELAAAALGDPAPEMLEHQACRLRGLIDRRGRMTAVGDAVLRAELRRRAVHA